MTLKAVCFNSIHWLLTTYICIILFIFGNQFKTVSLIGLNANSRNVYILIFKLFQIIRRNKADLKKKKKKQDLI